MPEARGISSQKYRGDVDGLRGIAVLAVVIFHAFPSIFPAGFAGVDVFFVISGFLITGIILRSLEHGEFSLANFYIRRARRIFPALSVMLAVSCVVAWFAFDAGEMKRLGLHAFGGSIFSSNMLLWHEGGYFDVSADRKPLQHLWSLAVEEQFYLLFPLGLLAAWKYRLRPLSAVGAIGAASFVLNLLVVKIEPRSSFYLLPTRAWELMLGAMLASAETWFSLPVRQAWKRYETPCAIIGVALLGAGFLFADAGAYPGWSALMPTLGTALLIFSRESWINRLVLSWRPLVGVGLISYPLYLWHWPLLSFARILGGVTPSTFVRFILVAAAFCLAWLTYQWIERPFRFGANGAKSAAYLLAALAAIGGAGLGAFLTGGFSFRPAARSVETYARSIAIATGKTSCVKDGTEGASCRIGVTEANPRALILGDSHAGSLLPAFARLAGEKNMGMRYAWVQELCPPLSSVKVPCVEKNRRAFEEALRWGVSDVFMLFYWSNYARGTMLESLLDKTIPAYREAGMRVYLVVDNPRQAIEDPRDALRRGKKTDDGINRYALTKEAYAEQQDKLVERLRQYLGDGVMIVDSRSAWCRDDSICPLAKNHVFLYGDDDHVSPDGAMLAYPYLREAFKAL